MCHNVHKHGKCHNVHTHVMWHDLHRQVMWHNVNMQWCGTMWTRTDVAQCPHARDVALCENTQPWTPQVWFRRNSVEDKPPTWWWRPLNLLTSAPKTAELQAVCTMCFSNEFPWFCKQMSRPIVNTFRHVEFAFYIRRVFLDYITGELHTSSLISFTKPIKCTNYRHNSIVFYHSNMFRHYCAIFTEFLHHVLKLTKTGEFTFRNSYSNWQ